MDTLDSAGSVVATAGIGLFEKNVSGRQEASVGKDAAEADGISLIPGIHILRKELSPEGCPLTHIHIHDIPK